MAAGRGTSIWAGWEPATAGLAVATWSTGWNYGAGWEEELLDAYGVGPDIDRIRYYRLLWDLTD
jgi:kanamycin kinase